MSRRIRFEIPELPEYGLRNIFGNTALARILDFLTLYRGSAKLYRLATPEKPFCA